MSDYSVSLSDTLRKYGTSSLVPDPSAPWYRRAAFYALRTIFEGPTTTFAWLLFIHALLWFSGTTAQVWQIDIIVAQGLSRSADPTVYGLVFVMLTGYQVLCHTALHCGPVWRTTVAAFVLFITSQTAIIPALSALFSPSLVMTGNYTVCALAFLVLSRSFPTWTSREHFYGRQ